MGHIIGTVSEVMSTPVITAPPARTLTAVTEQLLEEGVGSVVLATETPDGIVTKTDLLAGHSTYDAPAEQPVSAVASTPVVTIHPDQPLSTAARRLDERKIKHLVVVDQGIEGVVTTTDILNQLGSTTTGLLNEVAASDE
ncbi:CBS domain-containing protein [Halorientalis regularis]|uniref:CBS domain-containing protein n=2 Tax=Halorientalis regularis TaxID=660518 RepID=A0A1G7SZJ3_9EURY|nr:CBS domain-containing protein [Halorientalis regularis]